MYEILNNNLNHLIRLYFQNVGLALFGLLYPQKKPIFGVWQLHLSCTINCLLLGNLFLCLKAQKKQSVMGMQWLKAIPCFRIFYQEIKVPVRMLCKVLTLGVALGNFLFRGSFSFHEFRVYHCILKSV